MPNWPSHWTSGFGRRKPGPWVRVDWLHPLARGLVGVWLINQGGGNTLFNLLGTGGDLSGVNGPVTVSGFFGSGASNFLTGLNQYYSAGRAVVTSLPITISCWFNQNDTSVLSRIINLSGVTNGAVIGLSLDSSGRLRAEHIADSGTGSFASSANGSVVAGNWNSGVGVFTSSTKRDVYLNGVFRQTDATSIGTTTVSDTVAGAVKVLNTITNFDRGRVDHILIWNRALSAAEIGWLYVQPFAFLTQPAPKRSFNFIRPAVGAGFRAAWRRPGVVIGSGIYKREEMAPWQRRLLYPSTDIETPDAL